jgi:actin-related protein
MNEFSSHIVIDNGSCYTKSGFNGENAPRSVIPTVIGRFKNPSLLLTEDKEKLYFGKEATHNLATLNLNYPVENGIIKNWDYIEKLWNYLFYNELKVTPEAHNLFLTENIYNSNSDREKIAQIMFEKFNIFNIHIEPQPTMTLFSTSKTTGLIFESGDSCTQIVPIFEGYIIPQGVTSTPLAGRTLTDVFLSKIKDKLQKFKFSNYIEYAKKLKERYSFVKLEGAPLSNSTEIELPDGNKIALRDEQLNLPEIFFDPSSISLEFSGYPELVVEAIKKTDLNLRREFYANILLGGGNTDIKNFPERLKKEISSKIPSNIASYLRINSQLERKYSAWIGASVVCSIGTFQQMWISKNDYEEVGPHVIHKKYII